MNDVRGMELFRLEADVQREVLNFLMQNFAGQPASFAEQHLPMDHKLSDGRRIRIHGKAPEEGYNINIWVEFRHDA
jgi:hypothetical protein